MKPEYEKLAELGIDRKILFECEHMVSSTARLVGLANNTFANKKTKLLVALKIIQTLPEDTYEDKVLHGKIHYVFKAGKIVPKKQLL